MVDVARETCIPLMEYAKRFGLSKSTARNHAKGRNKDGRKLETFRFTTHGPLFTSLQAIERFRVVDGDGVEVPAADFGPSDLAEAAEKLAAHGITFGKESAKPGRKRPA